MLKVKNLEKPFFTIGIVLHKNPQYLKECVKSLTTQTFTNFEVIFYEGDSQKTASKELKKQFPELKLKIYHGKNLWHSGGHNFLARKAQGSYYICGSYDMIYSSDFLEKLAQNIRISEYKVFQPKIYIWNFLKNKKTKYLDSTGIGCTFYQKFFDCGQGEKDNKKYQKKSQVFGVSGACFTIETELLKEIKFDESIHYKNDCDLSYRLNWLGYQTEFLPEVICYHDRQNSKLKKKSSWEKENSEFGNQVTLFKNFSQEFSWKVRFFTKIYLQIRKIFYPTIKLPKNIVQSKKIVNPQEIEKIFS